MVVDYTGRFILLKYLINKYKVGATEKIAALAAPDRLQNAL